MISFANGTVQWIPATTLGSTVPAVNSVFWFGGTYLRTDAETFPRF